MKHARASLDAYLGTLKANEVDLDDIYSIHGALSRKLDNNILDLEQEILELEREEKLLRSQDSSADEELARLPWQIAINIFAQQDEDAELRIKYGA